MSSWLDPFGERLSADQWEELWLAEHKMEGGEWLLGKGVAEAQEILLAKSRFYRLPSIHLVGYRPEEEAVVLVAEEQARNLGIFPLFQRNEVLYVAVSEPDDLKAEDFVRKLTGFRVKPVLALKKDIVSAITRFHLSADRAARSLGNLSVEEEEGDDEVQEDVAQGQGPVVNLVQKILSQAIHLGASDIHLEPDEGKVFLRYRVDGTLHEYQSPPLSMYPAVVSRIKIISTLDIAEKRLPQDGRASIQVGQRDFDLRVSVLPNVHGEGVCIRILDPAATQMDLTQMGFDDDTLLRYDRVIRKPHGIVLVTGPTGSGKSTTLYATLKRIESRESKTITLEDPVEYKVSGLIQVPVKADIGYTFGVGLKAILRHDPDIVMLGEIRDLTSAEIAFRAALTGHLLFSTLHTNSAALAVTRLIDMGVPAYQVMAALSGVLAQRLVRRLCKVCKKPYRLSAGQVEALDVAADYFSDVVYEPGGCPECQNIGYKGRVAIHEFLEITPEMRRLSEHEVSAPNLEDMARPQGFKTLRQAALEKFRAGVTSLPEVLGTTGTD